MRSHTTEGLICLDGPYGLIYQIGKMVYVVYEDETYRYEFIPNWSVIDLLGSPEYQGVPGFNMDKRKDAYVRENMTPTFIAERAPSENREGLWELLADVGMDYLDKLEWLVRTDTRYIGDGFYVSTLSKFKRLSSIELTTIVADSQNALTAQMKVLKQLCAGESIKMHGEEIGSEARKTLHTMLRSLIEKTYGYREKQRLKGIRQAAEQGRYAGRKRKSLDPLVLAETIDFYDKGFLDAQQAAHRLNVSQATFFRRLKEYREATK